MHDHAPSTDGEQALAPALSPERRQQIADGLFHLRGRRTQVEFGALVGVTKRTIIRWESGDFDGMKLAHARRLVELGMAPELLLGTPTDGSIVVAVGTRQGAPAAEIVAESNGRANLPEQGAA